MLAAVYHGVGDIRVEEVDEPAFGEDEALLRVRAASICGTDLRIYTSGHHKILPGAPRILGHELAGEVVAVGSNVKGLSPGMRVGIAPNMGCGTCPQCIRGYSNLCPNYEAFGISLDGAFAEYMRLPASTICQGNIVPLPDALSYEEAALNEPFSCCYSGSRACAIGPGDTVLIMGAGPIGIMHLFLARLSGARTVIISEMIQDRLAQALDFGADLAVNPGEGDLHAAVLDATNGRGADVIIVAAPSPVAQEGALDLAAIGGRINFFGGLPKGQEFIRFNSNRVHYKQLVITGTTGSNNSQYRTTLEILGSRRVDLSPLISAKYPLENILEAFARARFRKDLKIVIMPPGG